MMVNKYVSFISDAHFLTCVGNLHEAYLKANNNISKSQFYANKIDTIKLTFDAKFNDIDEDDLINSEILRQIDKSINNAIGTFHEQILGGVEGYEVGNLSGFDIRAEDNSLFAIFQINSINLLFEEGIFEVLALMGKHNRTANCYLVDFTRDNLPSEKLIIRKSESTVSQKNVNRISLDKFYGLITKDNSAFDNLLTVLPIAIQDYQKKLNLQPF